MKQITEKTDMTDPQRKLTGLEYDLTKAGFFAHYLAYTLSDDLKDMGMDETATDVRQAAIYIEKLVGIIQSEVKIVGEV
jgi:hypothetical protein